jgi:hypothetical protein
MSQAYLLEHEPVRDQFRVHRRAEVSGLCVIHTAENAPDWVAFDGGAEAVARWITERTTPGSYHDLVDSDSAINLVPYDYEAYQDGTGSNPYAWGGSVATRADVWPLAPKHWRDGAIRQLAAAAARYAAWVRTRRGIVIPPIRITREMSELRRPGFISHAERDPARRRDPGVHFPWPQFFTEYDRARGARPPVITEVNDVGVVESFDKKSHEQLNMLVQDAVRDAVSIDHDKEGIAVKAIRKRVLEAVQPELDKMNEKLDILINKP